MNVTGGWGGEGGGAHRPLRTILFNRWQRTCAAKAGSRRDLPVPIALARGTV